MPYKLSKEKRDNVKQRIFTGQDTANIVVCTGVSKSTVLRMKKQINPNYKRQPAGRPSLIPSSAHTIIRLKLKTGQLTSIKAVQAYLRRLGYRVSYFTARKFIAILRFKCSKKKNTPALSFVQMKARRKWAREHRKWTVEDWKKVIFSDESRFNLWGSDGVQYTYRLKGEPLRPHNFRTRRQQGGGSLMVWGCMTAFGPGYACRLLEKSMNSDLYQYVLGTTYFNTLRYYGLQHDDVFFQQDGATCHTSESTYNWMDEKGMTYLYKWPANSPDLNPIEHLWHQVKSRLDKYEDKPSNINQLWERFDTEWNKFNEKTMEPYYNSYPKRIRAVIKAKGGHTSF